jgi:hypothetical protein
LKLNAQLCASERQAKMNDKHEAQLMLKLSTEESNRQDEKNGFLRRIQDLLTANATLERSIERMNGEVTTKEEARLELAQRVNHLSKTLIELQQQHAEVVSLKELEIRSLRRELQEVTGSRAILEKKVAYLQDELDCVRKNACPREWDGSSNVGQTESPLAYLETLLTPNETPCKSLNPDSLSDSTPPQPSILKKYDDSIPETPFKVLSDQYLSDASRGRSTLSASGVEDDPSPVVPDSLPNENAAEEYFKVPSNLDRASPTVPGSQMDWEDDNGRRGSLVVSDAALHPESVPAIPPFSNGETIPEALGAASQQMDCDDGKTVGENGQSNLATPPSDIRSTGLGACSIRTFEGGDLIRDIHTVPDSQQMNREIDQGSDQNEGLLPLSPQDAKGDSEGQECLVVADSFPHVPDSTATDESLPVYVAESLEKGQGVGREGASSDDGKQSSDHDDGSAGEQLRSELGLSTGAVADGEPPSKKVDSIPETPLEAISDQLANGGISMKGSPQMDLEVLRLSNTTEEPSTLIPPGVEGYPPAVVSDSVPDETAAEAGDLGRAVPTIPASEEMDWEDGKGQHGSLEKGREATPSIDPPSLGQGVSSDLVYESGMSWDAAAHNKDDPATPSNIKEILAIRPEPPIDVTPCSPRTLPETAEAGLIVVSGSQQTGREREHRHLAPTSLPVAESPGKGRVVGWEGTTFGDGEQRSDNDGHLLSPTTGDQTDRDCTMNLINEEGEAESLRSEPGPSTGADGGATLRTRKRSNGTVKDTSSGLRRSARNRPALQEDEILNLKSQAGSAVDSVSSKNTESVVATPPNSAARCSIWAIEETPMASTLPVPTSPSPPQRFEDPASNRRSEECKSGDSCGAPGGCHGQSTLRRRLRNPLQTVSNRMAVPETPEARDPRGHVSLVAADGHGSPTSVSEELLTLNPPNSPEVPNSFLDDGVTKVEQSLAVAETDENCRDAGFKGKGDAWISVTAKDSDQRSGLNPPTTKVPTPSKFLKPESPSDDTSTEDPAGSTGGSADNSGSTPAEQSALSSPGVEDSQRHQLPKMPDSKQETLVVAETPKNDRGASGQLSLEGDGTFSKKAKSILATIGTIQETPQAGSGGASVPLRIQLVSNQMAIPETPQGRDPRGAISSVVADQYNSSSSDVSNLSSPESPAVPDSFLDDGTTKESPPMVETQEKSRNTWTSVASKDGHQGSDYNGGHLSRPTTNAPTPDKFLKATSTQDSSADDDGAFSKKAKSVSGTPSNINPETPDNDQMSHGEKSRHSSYESDGSSALSSSIVEDHHQSPIVPDSKLDENGIRSEESLVVAETLKNNREASEQRSDEGDGTTFNREAESPSVCPITTIQETPQVISDPKQASHGNIQHSSLGDAPPVPPALETRENPLEARPLDAGAAQEGKEDTLSPTTSRGDTAPEEPCDQPAGAPACSLEPPLTSSTSNQNANPQLTTLEVKALILDTYQRRFAPWGINIANVLRFWSGQGNRPRGAYVINLGNSQSKTAILDDDTWTTIDQMVTEMISQVPTSGEIEAETQVLSKLSVLIGADSNDNISMAEVKDKKGNDNGFESWYDRLNAKAHSWRHKVKFTTDEKNFHQLMLYSTLIVMMHEFEAKVSRLFLVRNNCRLTLASSINGHANFLQIIKRSG